VAAGKQPIMIVVAGPVASGKTKQFRALEAAVNIDSINVDDRCKTLHGSYQNIPRAIGDRARAECETFIRRHIADGRSFLVETTLRTPIRDRTSPRSQRPRLQDDHGLRRTRERGDESLSRRNSEG
jgi:hypothetical protein